MSKIDDELLNKYIDNELDSVELSELKSVLDKDEEVLNRLKALKTVDNVLKKIQTEPAPNGFTDKVMNKISAAAKIVKPKVSYFFISVISIFSIAIVGILIFAFQNMKTDESKSKVDPILNNVKDFVSRNSGFWESLFKNNAVLAVGTTLSLVMLFIAYFSFESHKNFKNKLNSILH